jgi:hypothetical protein
MTVRIVEGHEFRKGSEVCPSPELCDRFDDESTEQYIARHCEDHNLGTFGSATDAERNLGVTCFYFFHKYVWGNPEMVPQPFWEIHAFIAEWNWNVIDLEQYVPVDRREFAIPPADRRREGEPRRMKQLEVPRQCQKTSAGARAYPVFRQLREYFLFDKTNYRIIVRSATGKNTRDTLAIIRRMSTRSQAIARLYGIWVTKCEECSGTIQTPERTKVCPTCASEKIRVKRISLINDTRGSGAFGKDAISFRWLTDQDDADAVAAYSIWVAGLETETTGQRPDLYIWDDPQTDKNARTPELRAKITERFDDSVRQLEFDGELLVLDTRKFVDDFAGKIRQEPLSSLFFSLHRKVRWPVNEPDAAPFVLDGYRYYYPVKGTGKRALDADAVNKLERQMSERNFSAEYMNEPLDPSKALFKREHFRVVDPSSISFPEVTYGLGRNLTPNEARELDMLGVRIVAYNSCDPAGKSEQSVRGDDTFIVGLRVDRYGSVYITYLAAGKWAASRTWDEIAKANAYNRPQFTDYELPADDKHVRPSFEKWVREQADAVGAAPMIPMKWQPMPKSQKHKRIEQMEQWTKDGRFFILSDAAEPALVEKYISQWVGYLVSDHDDGPDATSRLIRWLITNTYQQPGKKADEPEVAVTDGVASVPVSLLKELNVKPQTGGLWGQRGW